MPYVADENEPKFDYDEWSSKHSDSIALWIGIAYGIIMIIIAILVIKYI